MKFFDLFVLRGLIPACFDNDGSDEVHQIHADQGHVGAEQKYQAWLVTIVPRLETESRQSSKKTLEMRLMN
jgi:hypothetical protein